MASKALKMVSLEKTQIESLEKEAMELGTSFSALIREAIVVRAQAKSGKEERPLEEVIRKVIREEIATRSRHQSHTRSG